MRQQHSPPVLTPTGRVTVMPSMLALALICGCWLQAPVLMLGGAVYMFVLETYTLLGGWKELFMLLPQFILLPSKLFPRLKFGLGLMLGRCWLLKLLLQLTLFIWLFMLSRFLFRSSSCCCRRRSALRFHSSASRLLRSASSFNLLLSFSSFRLFYSSAFCFS